MRRFEIASIAAYCCVMSWFLCGLFPLVRTYPWLMASAFMLGFVLADLVSGVVHWLADTWGSPDMSVIGQALIRPFREHHVDQKEITRHGFVETNGNNCFISIGPAVCGALAGSPAERAATAASAVLVWLVVAGELPVAASGGEVPDGNPAAGRSGSRTST